MSVANLGSLDHSLGKVTDVVDLSSEQGKPAGDLLGMSYVQARALAPEVEQFTELGEYLDLPVRTYSSGMLLRLAFAVTTSIRPDILILDEMISAGDA